MSTLFAWILTVMVLFAPNHPREHLIALAKADVAIVNSEPRLFVGDEDGKRTAAYIMAVQYRESGFDNSAVGDHGKSLCSMQIQGAMLSLLGDPEGCVREGFRIIHLSFKLCRHLPIEERLSYYARGNCASEDGRRISRNRWALAQKFAKIPAPVVAMLD
jgi:hypothetical protein